MHEIEKKIILTNQLLVQVLNEMKSMAATQVKLVEALNELVAIQKELKVDPQKRFAGPM